MQSDDRSESFTRALFVDGSPPQPSKSSKSCVLPQTQTQPPAQRTSSSGPETLSQSLRNVSGLGLARWKRSSRGAR